MGILDASKANSANAAWSNSLSNASSNSWSNTAGIAASQTAKQNAENANNSALEAWRLASEFNAKQAEINRAWQERMANTQYQRAIEDMKKAGINPILAVANGVSGASIGSGAMASMTAPNTFMANTFAEQNSASTSTSNSNSQSESSGWSNSESGLATALESIGTLAMNMLDKMNASHNINIALDGLDKLIEKGKETAKETVKGVSEKSNPTYTEMQKNNYGSPKIKSTDTISQKIWKGLEMMNKGLQGTNGGMGMLGR